MSDFVDITSRYYRFVFYHVITDIGAKLVPRCCTFSDFVLRNVIIDKVAIPGAQKLPNSDTVCGLFSEVGRLLFISTLQLFKDLFDSNLCVHTLSPDDLIVVLDDGNAVKFRQGLSYVHATKSMISKNFAMLADIIDKTILSKCKTSWVGEIDDLLGLLKSNGFENMELIFSHTSLLDMCDKINGFTRGHKYLLSNIKDHYPHIYQDVLASIVFRSDWETPVINNPYLLDCYDARRMDKTEAPKQAAQLLQSSSSSQAVNQQPAAAAQKNVPTAPSRGRRSPPAPSPAAGILGTPPSTSAYPFKSTIQALSPSVIAPNNGKVPPPPPPPPIPTGQLKKPFVRRYNHPGSDPREEVLFFYRNVGVHGLDRSIKNGMELYGLRGLNIMLLSTLPHLSSSLMGVLHRHGLLRRANIPRVVK